MVAYHPPDAVRAAMAYAADTSRRNGRRDWYFLFLGLLSDISVAVAFDPDRAPQMWRAVSGFAHAFLAGYTSVGMCGSWLRR